MTVKILIVAALTFVGFVPLAQAQEYWHEGRGQEMHWLREACESGDYRACWRLREMRHEWLERREQYEQHEWRERQERDQDFGGYHAPRERD